MFGEADHGLWPESSTATDHPVTRAWAGAVAGPRPRPAPWRGRERPARWWPSRCVATARCRRSSRSPRTRCGPRTTTTSGSSALVADQLGQILAVATARARERARLEALAAIDAAKTAFLSNVSHEFRTPLTLLLAPLEDVLHGRRRPWSWPDVEVMHQSAHRLLRMVNALLDVARIEADGLTPTLEPTDLVLLTLDLLQPFTAAAARAGLTLETDLDPDLGPVLTDPELWEKIVLNLVANAIKFTSRGGVTVALTSRADEVVLRVTDTGTGIPSSDVDRVFERFHRVQSHGSNPAEGTGIGLTLVAEAARALGGSARVESEEGVGSTFEVVAPLVPRHGPLQSSWKPQHSAARGAGHRGRRRTTTRRPTVIGRRAASPPPRDPRRRGQRCAEVQGLPPADVSGPASRRRPTGSRLSKSSGPSRIDLVVSDVMMPRLDGLGLLEAIRGDETLRSTPVVLLSARAGAESAAGAIEAGADDYVVKPFTPGELLARCRTSPRAGRVPRQRGRGPGAQRAPGRREPRHADTSGDHHHRARTAGGSGPG